MKQKMCVCVQFIAFLLLLFAVFPVSISATTGTVLDGKISITDDLNTLTVSGTTVTITAQAARNGNKTNNVTLTNNTESNAQISFTWSSKNSAATGSNTITVDGIENASGTFNKTIKKGESIAITVYSKSGILVANTATLTLKDFSYTEVSDSYNVTVDTQGQGTVSVSGAEKNTAGSYAVSPTDGATLTATAATGYTFLGWIDGDNKLLSSSASYLCQPASEMTVTAIFTSPGTKAWFSVSSGSTYLYDDLSKAFDKGTTAVLAADGTLSAGNYEIPSDKKLLIPYSDTDSGNFGDPEASQTNTAVSAFRTLTVTSGATIKCSGSICVNAVQFASSNQYTGHVTGGYGSIFLQDGARLDLEENSSLYCYGYIYGAGEVVANSGAKVHELLQIADWRGGTNTLVLQTSLKGESFLVSQYYAQNIESKFTVYSGATDTVHAAITASIVGTQQSGATFIGTGGFLQMSDGGYLTRTYSSDGQISYELHGDTSVGSVELKVSTHSLKSSDYVMAIPSNFSVTVASGTLTIPSSIKLLPNSKLEIKKGAEVKLSKPAKLILYDYDDWTSGNYTYNSTFFPVKYSPTGGKTALSEENASLIVDGTLTVPSGTAVYSTNQPNTEKANTCVSGIGTINYQGSTDNSTIKEVSGSSTDLVEIALVPLQINKAKTGWGSISSTGEYKVIEDNGTNYWYKNSTEVDATCVEAGYTKYYCDDANSFVKVTISTKPATGNHVDGDKDGKCDVCGAAMYTYSVTISWSQTGTAKYTEGQTTYTWDAANLTWVESGKAAGTWSGNSVVTVTIDNSKSTGAVNASCAYTNAAGFNATASGDTSTNVAAGGTGSVSMTITPAKNDTISENNTTIGTITITLTKGG